MIVDVHVWCDFSSLRSEWRGWGVSVIDIQGCLHLSHPHSPEPVLPLQSEDTRELMVLEAAAAAGWTIGRRRGPHRNDLADKVLSLSKSHSNKLYVLCCLGLADLHSKRLGSSAPQPEREVLPEHLGSAATSPGTSQTSCCRVH